MLILWVEAGLTKGKRKGHKGGHICVHWGQVHDNLNESLPNQHGKFKSKSAVHFHRLASASAPSMDVRRPGLNTWAVHPVDWPDHAGHQHKNA